MQNKTVINLALSPDTSGILLQAVYVLLNYKIHTPRGVIYPYASYTLVGVMPLDRVKFSQWSSKGRKTVTVYSNGNIA